MTKQFNHADMTNSVNVKDNHFETEKFSIIVVKINRFFQLTCLAVMACALYEKNIIWIPEILCHLYEEVSVS